LKPLLRFVPTQNGCGISVHSVGALNWLLKMPPPETISVYLSRDVFNQLQEAAGGTPSLEVRDAIDSRKVLPVRASGKRRPGVPSWPKPKMENSTGRESSTLP
jgi:hypothetical protein